MLIVVQFPLTDMRPFLTAESGRIHRPSWPLPKQDEEFIRSFGLVRLRWRGGLNNWVGESSLIVANRALRVPLSPEAAQVLGGSRFRVVFRTLFCDGTAVNKFEIGFAAQSRVAADFTIEQAVKALLALPVAVPNSLTKKAWQGPLAAAGKPLARQYLAATTKAASFAAIAKSSGWIEAGAPVVLVENIEGQGWAHKSAAQETYAGAGDLPAVEHRLVNHDNQRLNLWTCTSGVWTGLERAQLKARQQGLREMRISLLRIHAERECLLNVLRRLERPEFAVTPKTPASDNLQRYLRDATQRILKREAAANIPVVALANQYDDLAMPGVRSSIMNSIQKMRPYVQALVSAVVNAQVTLTGEQFKQVQAALIDGFTEETLAMMTRGELDQRLDVIAGGDNLEQIVFNLLNWAERQGRLGELIAAACRANPDNPKLQAITALL